MLWELLTAWKAGLTSTGYLREVIKWEHGKILLHTSLPVSSTHTLLSERQLRALEHTGEWGKPAVITHCTVCCDPCMHSLGETVYLRGP